MFTKDKGGQVDQNPGDFVPFWNESPGRQPVKPDLFIFRAALVVVYFPAVHNIAKPRRLINTFRDEYLRADKIIVYTVYIIQ